MIDLLHQDAQVEVTQDYREDLEQEIERDPILFCRLATEWAKKNEDDFMPFAIDLLERERSTVGRW